jgi:Lrp/AsnC family transcriptional regulator, leucine-responsive regulatory protein
MTKPSFSMDQIAWKVLEALQEDARLSFAEIGRRVGLSTPAAAERVRRLEQAGIINGYHARVNLAKLGLPLLVFVRMTVTGGGNPMASVVNAARQMPEVIECHRVTGEDSFILKAQLCSVAHLESLINRLYPLGATTTCTVLSSPVQRRNISLKDLDNFHLRDS